jgi:hypothetical protein
MSHDATGKLTTAIAALAVASLPFVARAQSSSTPQQPWPATSAARPSAASPQSHLDQAKRALDSINASSLKGEARTQFAELKEHFAQLETAWRTKTAADARKGATPSSHAGGHTAPTGGMTSGTAAATAAGTSGTPEQVGATGPTTRQTPTRTGTMGNSSDSDAVMTHYTALSAVLDRLSAQNPNVDASAQRQLGEFRKHLSEFHTLAMSQSAGRGAASNASPSYPSAASEASGAVASGAAASAATTGAIQTPDPAASSPSASDAAIARLTAQIDELLAAGKPASGTVGTSGSLVAAGTVCVDRAKLEQLRIDLQALRGQPR